MLETICQAHGSPGLRACVCSELRRGEGRVVPSSPPPHPLFMQQMTTELTHHSRPVLLKVAQTHSTSITWELVRNVMS